MARIKGIIESAGEGFQGLRITAYEETRVGIEFDDKPCRMSWPDTVQIGQATTDVAGSFNIDFNPQMEPAFACAFNATVHVNVFDRGTLIWRSPRKPITPVVRFQHEILAAPQPDTNPSAAIRGTLTLCGRPAVGCRVMGFEVLQIGFPTPLKPCVKGSPNSRHVGITIVDEQGRWKISYSPTIDPGACFFSAAVRVEAFDAAARIWTSPVTPISPSLRFDHELAPTCSPGDTLVLVVNDLGQPVAGAEVVADGEFAGVTDEFGQLSVTDLRVGSHLAARQLLLEHDTNRPNHNQDSNRNWNYRVYITNQTLIYDQNGNNPQFEGFEVSNLNDVQELVVRRRNTIIGYNLMISVEWDATTSQLKYYMDRFIETSELIFNATDGQFYIEHVTILDNGRSWNQADYRIHTDWNQPSYATVGGIAGAGGRVTMNPFDSFYPGTLMHEFGHYGFSLLDEYKAGDCWPEGEPVFCTAASDVPGTDFSENGSRDACLMRGARFGSRKKFCSGHPANPHVDCTAQGPEDCWSVIVQRYSGFPQWHLRTPVSRGVIVDRLPDSGISLDISTSVPAGADLTGSYIPVGAWKPSWHTSSVERAGQCPDLVVRVLQSVSPVGGARVTLSSGGRSLYQGVTSGRSKSLPDGSSVSVGEISIRGGHVGDTVQVQLQFGNQILQKTVAVESCDTPLVVTLPQIAVPTFLIRCRPLDLGQLELVAETAQTKNVVPPTIAILRDGEDEPYVIEPEADQRGRRYCAFLPTGTEDHNVEIRATIFDENGRQAVARNRVAVRRFWVSDSKTVRSAGGELELAIPSGGLRAPTLLVIEEAQDVPPPDLGKGDILLIPPHRICSSSGNSLLKHAMLHLSPGGELEIGPYGASLCIEEYQEDKGGWYQIRVRVNEVPLVASARINTLGVFALVRHADYD